MMVVRAQVKTRGCNDALVKRVVVHVSYHANANKLPDIGDVLYLSRTFSCVPSVHGAISMRHRI